MILKKFLLKLLTLFIFLALWPNIGLAFSDVPEDYPYRQAIQFIEEKGVEKGTVFSPEKLMTRGEFAEWLLETEAFDEKAERDSAPNEKPSIKAPVKLKPYFSFLARSGFYGDKKNPTLKPNKPILLFDALKLTYFVKGISASRVIKKEEWPFKHIGPKIANGHLLLKAYKLNLLPKAREVLPASLLTRAEAAQLLFEADQSIVKSEIPTLRITLESNQASNGNHEVVKHEKFPLLINAWDRINQKFLHRDNLDKTNLLYGAIAGMVKELKDPYSEFARPLESTIQETLSGQLEGIGAYIEADAEGRIRIVAPLKSSPAEASGLLPNDIIIEVNGEKLTGLTVSQAASKIRGPAGSAVTLKIQRNGKAFETTVTRARVNVPTVILEMTPDNIAHLTITNFGNRVTAEFAAAVAKIQKLNPRGIVLDLRNNPGGFLDASIVLAGYFIESGKTVAKVRYPDREDVQLSAGEAELRSFPLRILVNKGSASASEILAGALRDHGLGKIIGEKTFGKGSVQELTTYADDSSLKITVAEWLTPNGGSIEKVGITPDIEVKRTEEDMLAKRDPQLDRALSELRGP